MSSDSRAPAVRRYEPGDGPDIEAVHRRALRTAGTNPEDVPDIEDVRSIGHVYLDAGGEFLVAERDGQIVATGGFVREGRTAELKRIAVDPDAQRSGFGSAILDGLEARAARQGCRRVVLTTARRQQAATEFYPARGYELVERRRINGYTLLEFAKSL